MRWVELFARVICSDEFDLESSDDRGILDSYLTVLKEENEKRGRKESLIDLMKLGMKERHFRLAAAQKLRALGIKMP
jgi:hypothetical protein